MNVRPLRSVLKRGVARWPEATLTAASAVGWATQGRGRGVPAEAIRRVRPDLQPEQLEAARRATWSASLRSRVLDLALAVPGAPHPYPRLVSAPDPQSIKPPAVLATFHAGPLSALGLLLEQLPGEVLALQAGNDLKAPARPGRTVLHVGDEEWDRAAAFGRALEMLNSRGFVLLAVDGLGSRAIAVELFGKSVGLARGAFALARISGAPIVPLSARWRGAGIEIAAGDPLSPAEEHVMAAAFARWMEARVREAPGNMSPELARMLLRE